MIVPRPLKRQRQRSIYQQLGATYTAAGLADLCLEKKSI